MPSIASTSSKIEKCDICLRENRNWLNTSEKPYVAFLVEELWKPKDKDDKPNVCVLFIAESPPPWNVEQKYFYNRNTPNRSSGLKADVFKRLNIESLEQFRTNGYFLIDAIKCRLKKKELINGKKVTLNVPQKVLKNCTEQFLEQEIKELNPKTIFVLGDTAKKALQQFSEFRKLRFHNVTDKDDFDEVLSGYRVILCPFPSIWNKVKYENKINRAFLKIAWK
jgi:uracil-DNA glycosylase